MKPVFNKPNFGNIEFEKIDYDKNTKFVIQRVFERGDVPDIRECRSYYGIYKTTDTLSNAHYLPEIKHYILLPHYWIKY